VWVQFVCPVLCGYPNFCPEVPFVLLSAWQAGHSGPPGSVDFGWLGPVVVECFPDLVLSWPMGSLMLFHL
jgi:hypothetical protein